MPGGRTLDASAGIQHLAVDRGTRSRSPQGRAPEQTSLPLRARQQRSWGFVKGLVSDLDTWSKNPWSLVEWLDAVESANPSELPKRNSGGATRHMGTMARAAVYLVRSRANGDADPDRNQIPQLAHHIALQYPSSATQHGVNRRVVELLYDFLNTRLECAAIRLAVDQVLHLDDASDSDTDSEQRLRADILEEATFRANQRASEIKRALGMNPRL